MGGWQAKKFQLPNHNFETTAIRFEDGRAGLCYHGSAIWDDGSGGWEAFIASDWNTVWKEGRPCTFKDLPLEMRIACPACGAKINPEAAECSKCGIIFEKIKEDAAESETGMPAPEEETRETPRSKLLDISLAGVVVIIAGFFIYNALKPEPPQLSTGPGSTIEAQPLAGRSEQPFSQPEASQYSPTEDRTDMDNGNQSDFLPSDEPSSRASDAMEQEQFYSHINLDDLETASRQLQEEVQQINEEGRQVEKDLITASTPEEQQLAAERKSRYNNKAQQLSQLIKDFNARNESRP